MQHRRAIEKYSSRRISCLIRQRSHDRWSRAPSSPAFFPKPMDSPRSMRILTALLCGGASGLGGSSCGKGSPQAIIWAVVLGVLIALVAYLALAPESVVTGCLVSARKRFLDDQVTSAEVRADSAEKAVTAEVAARTKGGTEFGCVCAMATIASSSNMTESRIPSFATASRAPASW